MTQPNPFEAFVNSFEKLIVAVSGAEMARNGVIGAYPEKFKKEIAAAKKEIVEFLSSQDPEAKPEK